MGDQLDQAVGAYLSTQKMKSSTDPLDVAVNSFISKKQGGKPNPYDDTAVSNAKNDIGDQSFNNLCEKFVEQTVYGKTGLFGSAAEAWTNYAREGKVVADDPSNAPSGAMIFFSPDSSNQGDGHVGLSDGQGNIVAATSNGVQSIPIDQWVSQTNQVPLGYVIP